MEKSTTSILECAMEAIACPALVFNQNAVITLCNSAAEEYLLEKKKDVEGRRLVDLGYVILDDAGVPQNNEWLLTKLHQEGGTPSRPRVFGLQTGANREIRWFCGTSKKALVAADHSDLTLLTFTDVSELIHNNAVYAKITQAKNEWETTVDALQDIVTIQDRSMRIVRANRAAHDLFGHKLGELKGKRCYEAFLGRKRPCTACPVKKTLADSCPHSATIYYSRLGKTFSVSSFPILADDGCTHLLVHVARDVTQYLQNESEKNLLMAAIVQASEAVVITDHQGKIQFVNPAFENSSGYGRGEAIGKNPSLLKSGVHERQFYQLMWQTLTQKEVWRGKITNRRKNGSLFKEEVTISPVVDTRGRICNYVAIKRDVSTEELLEKQLHQVMKMEALGTLAGGIAHDFNNILASMIGYSEMARDRLEQGHPAQQDLEQVLASGDRAVDLVRQILTFSRKESAGQFRVFKLQHIVKEIIKLLRPTLPATIALRHDIDPSCRSIFADPSQIYQVVMNLCTNARQAIGTAHGSILIRLTEIKEQVGAAFEKSPYFAGAFLDLEITDSGCGIATEDLERIFDPFFTTKRKNQGTGLGLAVVHGIVKKHKGEINVSSKLGEGTTFHVYFSVDGRKESAKVNEYRKMVRGEERIMVVDDEVTVAEVFRHILHSAGYQVEVFTESIAAVKHFRANPECCDLVLTDLQMPQLTGVELAREVLSQRPNLPVIVATGHNDDFDLRRMRQMGIHDLLLKPIKPKKLQQAIRKALDNGKNTDN